MEKKAETTPTKAKRPPRRMSANIQTLAKIDRILQEIEEKKPGTADAILWWLCESRGIKWADGEELA